MSLRLNSYSNIVFNVQNPHTQKCADYSLVPKPHPRGEGLVTSSWSLGLHYFLESDFSPPIRLQKTQSVVQHLKKSWLYTLAWWHSTFLACKLVIGSQLCIQQQAMNFWWSPRNQLDVTRPSPPVWVGSGDETTTNQIGQLIYRVMQLLCTLSPISIQSHV